MRVMPVPESGTYAAVMFNVSRAVLFLLAVIAVALLIRARSGDRQVSAQSIDALLRDELLEIARLKAGGLSRYEGLRRLELEVDPDPGDHLHGTAFARRPGPMRSRVGEGRSVEESLRRPQGERGGGEMLDPSWTPERGRSHVAALAGMADERQS